MRLRAAAATALAVALLHSTIPTAQVPRRNLSVDERRGGHTMARHVARTNQQLRQRLRDQPDISAASTYPDLDTAELTVGRLLEENAARITTWTNRRGRRPNLVLRGTDSRGPPVGRVLERGARTPVLTKSAVAVLRWNQVTRSFYVLTSYPEIRE